MTALTDASVKKLPAPAKGSRITYDPNPAGFGIRVTTAGVKSFIFTYRVRGTQRQRCMTIGRCENWSVGAARKEARRLKQIVDMGGDPLGDIEDERGAPSMLDLITRFDEEHIGPRLRPMSQLHYRGLIERHVKPHFGQNIKVADVRYEDVDSLHRKISKGGAPYAANRTVAVLSKMFSLAIRWNMRSDNPARGIERNTEPKRKRYLKPDELAALTKALAAHSNQQVADIIRLLLLTGARSGEATAARWDNLDLGEGVWSKPGSTTKQKTDHVAPLSAPARQLLSEIRAEQIANGRQLDTWVFPSVESKVGHIVDMTKNWRTICKAAGIEDLRPHDLRHSFASQLASGGASLQLVGALLGHSNPVTTARYSHLYIDPQRQAVERVGAAFVAAGKAEATTEIRAFPKTKR